MFTHLCVLLTSLASLLPATGVRTGGPAATAAGPYRSRFVKHRYGKVPVEIHYLEKNESRPGQVSLVYVPGNWEPAGRAVPLLDALDGHSVSISFRGHGLSSTPRRGYDLEYCLADLEAVVDAAGVEKMCLVGFSRGVGYALGYVRRHPDRVAGLVLVDCPPVHYGGGAGYAARWKNLIYLGQPVTRYWRPAAIDALEREAREVSFADDLARLDMPVLILRGTDASARIPSLLQDRDMQLYLSRLTQGREVRFEYSGHMIPDEELGKFRPVIRKFMRELDGEERLVVQSSGE